MTGQAARAVAGTMVGLLLLVGVGCGRPTSSRAETSSPPPSASQAPAAEPTSSPAVAEIAEVPSDFWFVYGTDRDIDFDEIDPYLGSDIGFFAPQISAVVIGEVINVVPSSPGREMNSLITVAPERVAGMAIDGPFQIELGRAEQWSVEQTAAVLPEGRFLFVLWFRWWDYPPGGKLPTPPSRWSCTPWLRCVIGPAPDSGELVNRLDPDWVIGGLDGYATIDDLFDSIADVVGTEPYADETACANAPEKSTLPCPPAQ